MITVCRASPEDAEAIVALQVANHGQDCERTLRRLFAEENEGPGIFTVAIERGRVVSALCLLQEAFDLDGVAFGVGRVEFVARDPSRVLP
jgi:hypothetical protein